MWQTVADSHKVTLQH